MNPADRMPLPVAVLVNGAAVVVRLVIVVGARR
jgi:hypothetical protein